MSSPIGVLVADDDPDIRTLVALAVSRSGLDLIDELSDGDSTWEAIQTFAPDLVVLDVSMPGKTGLELSRLIRADAQTNHIWIILLSAAVDPVSRQAGLDAGANEYLIKPFSPRLLAERLVAVASEISAR